MENLDQETVESFGEEWARFDQSKLSLEESQELFAAYFRIFPWTRLTKDSIGFDMGCGSGRWANHVAKRVGHLNCIDPSSAIDVARHNLKGCANISFFQASVDDEILPPNSQDFGYSLGVLHHVPDTRAAFKSCARMLKSGAPFLVYLYYDFENRPFWFSLVWKASELIRKWVSKRRPPVKAAICEVLVWVLYVPIIKAGNLAQMIGFSAEHWPLNTYQNASLYTIRTDARDRFGTKLEQRFSKAEITKLFHDGGFSDIQISEAPPYWCAVGVKRRD